MYDLLIIGAGPAGANLARLIGDDPNNLYKTVIVDKRALDQPSDYRRIKSCGGLLSPDAQHMLAELDLSLPSYIMDSPQFFKVRTLDFDNQIERDYRRLYYNIDREKFDRHLFSLISKRVEKIPNTIVKTIDPMDGYWEIELVQDNKSYKIQARCIVGADGANSFTRRKIISSSRKAKYFSIQKSYEATQKLPYFIGVFDSDITDYYSWMIQKKDSILLGTALPCTEKNPHLKFDLLKQKVNAYLGLNLEVEHAVEGAFIERTFHPNDLLFTHFTKTPNGEKLPLALIGEASGAASPTSAEGISYALKTSLYFYRALTQSSRHNYKHILAGYERRCHVIRNNIAFKTVKSPGMYHPKIRGLVMRTGFTAINKKLQASSPLHLSQTSCGFYKKRTFP
ncbi:FAD-binding protein [Fusibacter bizertensis]